MTELLLLPEKRIEKSSRIKRAAQFLMKAFTQKPVETQAVQAPVPEKFAAPVENSIAAVALPRRTPSVEVDSAFQSAVKIDTDTKSLPATALPQRQKQETDTAFSYVAEKQEPTNVIDLSSRIVTESTPLPQRDAGDLEDFSYFKPKPRLAPVPDIDPLTGPITLSENDPTPMFDRVTSDVAVARQEQLETPEFARLKAEFAARETHQ